MKMVFERNQKSAGVIGRRQVFSVMFRAEVTQEEKDAINKYKFADEVVYSNGEVQGGSGIIGVAQRAYLRSKLTKIVVRDLVNGTTVECDDIGEMLEIESQVLEAAKGLKSLLNAALTFGGRIVIEVE